VAASHPDCFTPGEVAHGDRLGGPEAGLDAMVKKKSLFSPLRESNPGRPARIPVDYAVIEIEYRIMKGLNYFLLR
jgi:hypothetical protein